VSTTTDKIDIRTVLPLTLPMDKLACPMCWSSVILTQVLCWGTDSGEILEAEYDCDTEPDMDSEEWDDWFRGHHERMPYVYWLPFQQRLLTWLNETYYMGSGDK